MRRIVIRNRWVNLAAPAVISAVLFAGVLVWFGASFAYAVGYSVTFNTIAVLVKWRRERRGHQRVSG